MRRQNTLRSGTALSQRQLRVGEQIRHVVADLLLRGAVHDPAITGTTLTVSEARVSRDLRQATVYVTELGGDLRAEIAAALTRAAPYLGGEVARQMHLKYAPRLVFKADESFAEGARIDALLARHQRLGADPDEDGDG